MGSYISIIYWKDCNLQVKKKILSRPILDSSRIIQKTVKKIITDVRNLGDKALLNYTNIFDNVSLNSIKIDTK